MNQYLYLTNNAGWTYRYKLEGIDRNGEEIISDISLSYQQRQSTILPHPDYPHIYSVEKRNQEPETKTLGRQISSLRNKSLRQKITETLLSEKGLDFLVERQSLEGRHIYFISFDRARAQSNCFVGGTLLGITGLICTATGVGGPLGLTLMTAGCKLGLDAINQVGDTAHFDGQKCIKEASIGIATGVIASAFPLNSALTEAVQATVRGVIGYVTSETLNGSAPTGKGLVVAAAGGYVGKIAERAASIGVAKELATKVDGVVNPAAVFLVKKAATEATGAMAGEATRQASHQVFEGKPITLDLTKIVKSGVESGVKAAIIGLQDAKKIQSASNKARHEPQNAAKHESQDAAKHEPQDAAKHEPQDAANKLFELRANCRYESNDNENRLSFSIPSLRALKRGRGPNRRDPNPQKPLLPAQPTPQEPPLPAQPTPQESTLPAQPTPQEPTLPAQPMSSLPTSNGSNNSGSGTAKIVACVATIAGVSVVAKEILPLQHMAELQRAPQRNPIPAVQEPINRPVVEVPNVPAEPVHMHEAEVPNAPAIEPTHIQATRVEPEQQATPAQVTPRQDNEQALAERPETDLANFEEVVQLEEERLLPQQQRQETALPQLNGRVPEVGPIIKDKFFKQQKFLSEKGATLTEIYKLDTDIACLENEQNSLKTRTSNKWHNLNIEIEEKKQKKQHLEAMLNRKGI